jgi:hypothetical protein
LHFFPGFPAFIDMEKLCNYSASPLPDMVLTKWREASDIAPPGLEGRSEDAIRAE